MKRSAFEIPTIDHDAIEARVSRRPPPRTLKYHRRCDRNVDITSRVMAELTLSVPRSRLAAASVGDLIIFAGGRDSAGNPSMRWTSSTSATKALARRWLSPLRATLMEARTWARPASERRSLAVARRRGKRAPSTFSTARRAHSIPHRLHCRRRGASWRRSRCQRRALCSSAGASSRRTRNTRLLPRTPPSWTCGTSGAIGGACPRG